MPDDGITKAQCLLYTRGEMGRIWSEENKFQKWLDVELAATETLAKQESSRGRRPSRAEVSRKTSTL